MRAKVVLTLTLFALGLGVRPAHAQPATTGQAVISPVAKAYLIKAIELFRTKHMNRAKVDWAKLSAEAYGKAAGAQTPADVYPAINLIINRLGERHTLLIPADAARAMEADVEPASGKPVLIDLPEAAQLASGPLIVRLPNFVGNPKQGTLYADTIRRALKAAERRGTCGIILDLRNDGGGNMWPMLNGLAGLFRDGVLGSFDTSSGGSVRWLNRGGSVAEESESSAERFGKPMRLRNPDRPVAVLIGPGTKSSGEFTAMAFRGRPNTRFFGQPSGGYVSVNDTMSLSDGAVIAMSVGYGRDRTGRGYTTRLEPDVPTQGGGPTLDTALAWLGRQNCGAKKLSRSAKRA